jgi:hypothetical protein
MSPKEIITFANYFNYFCKPLHRGNFRGEKNALGTGLEFDSAAFDSNSRVSEWSTFASDVSSRPDDREVTRECIEPFARRLEGTGF